MTGIGDLSLSTFPRSPRVPRKLAMTPLVSCRSDAEFLVNRLILSVCSDITRLAY